MTGKGRGRQERQEPVLERPESLFDIRLDPADRAAGAPPTGAGRRKSRIEPRVDDAPRAQSEPAPRPAPEPRAPARRRAQPKARKPRRRSFSPLLFLMKWGLILSLWGAVAVGVLVVYEASKLPPMQTLMIPKRPPTVMIQAADGKVMASRGDMGGAAVPLRELPPYLPKAFIAIEDRRFFEHMGVDPWGFVRAVAANVVSRRVRQGGSTLTQQLAKNLFLTQERTFSRKIQELILALWLEQKFSKTEILDLYMNRVYFGAGAYGVEAAAQRYFSKSARTVTLAEAAMLAGIVNAPSRLAPTRNLKAAQDRAALVLAAMRDQGLISPEMAAAALARPAVLVRSTTPGSFGYVADWVMDQLDSYVGELSGDVVVHTTIEPALQGAAQGALSDVLGKSGPKLAVSQGALVSLSTDGAVRALVGGKSYEESQYNRAVVAHRQPGSSFKSFIYLTALEHGLTPDTVREDAPIQVKGWRPENYTHQYHGPVSLEQALAQSLNTVSVRLTLEVGPKAVAATARRLGITSPLDPNASIALGTSEVTVLEMAGAYAPFANGGLAVAPYVIDSVTAQDGRTLYARSPAPAIRVIAPQYVAMMNRMMSQVLISGTARKADLPGWEAAGKTGTSQDYRDAWFVGFTARFVTAVWLGNDDSSPTKATGGGLPVEIWSRFMKTAHQGVAPMDLPGGARSPDPGIALQADASVPQEMPPNPVGVPPSQAQAPMTLDRWFVETFLGGARR